MVTEVPGAPFVRFIDMLELTVRLTSGALIDWDDGPEALTTWEPEID